MLSSERRNGGSGQGRTGREAEGQRSISLDAEPQPIAVGNPGDGCRLGASSRPSRPRRWRHAAELCMKGRDEFIDFGFGLAEKTYD